MAETDSWVAMASEYRALAVLLHELGHALMGKAFGLVPIIDLHGFGGTTSFAEGILKRKEPLSPGRSILVSLAGPFSGFVLGGVTLALVALRGRPIGIWHDVVQYILLVNIGWGVFNLLPILPLDGGNVVAAGLSWFSKDKAPKLARYVSIVSAVLLIALLGVRYGLSGLFTRFAFLCVFSAFIVLQNVRALQVLTKVDAEKPLHGEIDEGFREIEKGNGARAIAIAEGVFSRSATYDVRRSAIKLLAYGRLMEGQWGQLMQLLEATRIELGADELARFEQAARELDRPDDAARIRELLMATVTGMPTARS